MEAKDSVSGLYAWKSILRRRDVILDGACWQVGDGRDIKIWQHHWLLIKHPPKITSPVAIDSIYWQPPQSEVCKVNYDGAVFSESNKLGLGVTIRNNNGQVIASLSQQLNQAYKPIEVEVMAAIRGLEFAAKLDWDRVVVKGDSSIVMNGLKTKEPGLSSFGWLISDACVSKNLFSELSYSHVKREGNKVAHYLVKLVVNYPNNIILMEDYVPLSVFIFVQVDLVTVLE